MCGNDGIRYVHGSLLGNKTMNLILSTLWWGICNALVPRMLERAFHLGVAQKEGAAVFDAAAAAEERVGCAACGCSSEACGVGMVVVVVVVLFHLSRKPRHDLEACAAATPEECLFELHAQARKAVRFCVFGADEETRAAVATRGANPLYDCRSCRGRFHHSKGAHGACGCAGSQTHSMSHALQSRTLCLADLPLLPGLTMGYLGFPFSVDRERFARQGGL